MLDLPTQSGNGDGEGGQCEGGGDEAATAREERRVIAEVVLGLFWSDFGCFTQLDESEFLGA